MAPGGGNTTDGTEHHQHFKHGEAAPARHGCTDKGKDRDQQQCIALQDTQRARCLAEHDLHVQRAADQRQADHPEQDQEAFLPAQLQHVIGHPASLCLIMCKPHSLHPDPGPGCI